MQPEPTRRRPKFTRNFSMTLTSCRTQYEQAGPHKCKYQRLLDKYTNLAHLERSSVFCCEIRPNRRRSSCSVTCLAAFEHQVRSAQTTPKGKGSNSCTAFSALIHNRLPNSSELSQKIQTSWEWHLGARSEQKMRLLLSSRNVAVCAYGCTDVVSATQVYLHWPLITNNDQHYENPLEPCILH